jgi:taurine dioxygenase
MAIEIKELSPNIGALISGIDLRNPLSAVDFAVIKKAYLDHQVIFFYDQDLSAVQFKELAKQFGVPYAHPIHHNLGGDLKEVTELNYNGSRSRTGTIDNKILWHTDGCYLEKPTEATLLTARVVPPLGGETMFCSMYTAYDMLHPAVQKALEGLEAHHAFPDIEVDTIDTNSTFGQTDTNRRFDRKDIIGRRQPVVIVHPETGRKALFVNRLFTRKIMEMPEIQSRHLLEMLHEHCANGPEFQVRFQWKPGAVAIWDNRCTLHYAVADYSSPRVLWRITVAGKQSLRGAASSPSPELKQAV